MIEIAKIGKEFYRVDRRKKFAVPTEFILTDATTDFYEDHCCISNINLHSAFCEYEKEDIENLNNSIAMNNISSCVSMDDIESIDIDHMNPIHINLNGMVISIHDICEGSVQYSYQSCDENYCSTSIVEDGSIGRFLRILEDAWLDFDYYISPNDERITDKVLFAFIYNIMLTTFIDEDIIEQTKNDIIEDILN